MASNHVVAMQHNFPEHAMAIVKAVETRNVDLPAKDRRAIAVKVGTVLEKSYELLLASQLVHWHVKGELFLPIHQLTEQHYEALFETLDILAERMRALGTEVPTDGATKSFSVSARLDGSSGPMRFRKNLSSSPYSGLSGSSSLMVLMSATE